MYFFKAQLVQRIKQVVTAEFHQKYRAKNKPYIYMYLGIYYAFIMYRYDRYMNLVYVHALHDSLCVL